MTSEIETLCKDKGLRMTGQRRIIAQVMSEASDHPDAEILYNRVNEIDSRISIATVYRTLKLFEEAGILESHNFGDGRSRYEVAETGSKHHHHIINIRTREITEFEDERLEALKQEIAARLGFRIVGERLELFCVPLDDKEN